MRDHLAAKSGEQREAGLRYRLAAESGEQREARLQQINDTQLRMEWLLRVSNRDKLDCNISKSIIPSLLNFMSPSTIKTCTHLHSTGSPQIRLCLSLVNYWLLTTITMLIKHRDFINAYKICRTTRKVRIKKIVTKISRITVGHVVVPPAEYVTLSIS